MAAIGQTLREEREARNISLEEVASATKIVPRYLEALEADRLDMMPGGFFIKGIIRSYAAAIGLNPDEVLARYRGAGLLDRQERGPQALPGPAARPGPRLNASGGIRPFEPALPIDAGPRPGGRSAASLVIEEAPKPRLSPAVRKRIFGWTWRTLAVVAVAAGLFALWSSRRPEPPPSTPETITSQTAVPPPQEAEPAPKPAAPAATGTGAGAVTTAVPEPAAESAAKPAPRSEAPPAAGEAWRGVAIEITFQAETWIQVRTDGELKVNGLFPAGATARARADEHILIHTGNAGGFTFRLNGQPAKLLGRIGQVITDIKITPENLRDFLEVPLSGPPTG